MTLFENMAIPLNLKVFQLCYPVPFTKLLSKMKFIPFFFISDMQTQRVNKLSRDTSSGVWGYEYNHEK